MAVRVQSSNFLVRFLCRAFFCFTFCATENRRLMCVVALKRSDLFVVFYFIAQKWPSKTSKTRLSYTNLIIISSRTLATFPFIWLTADESRHEGVVILEGFLSHNRKIDSTQKLVLTETLRIFFLHIHTRFLPLCLSLSVSLSIYLPLLMSLLHFSVILTPFGPHTTPRFIVVLHVFPTGVIIPPRDSATFYGFIADIIGGGWRTPGEQVD